MITGTLRNWFYHDPEGTGMIGKHLYGDVYGHIKFEDGWDVRTSPVVEFDGVDMVKTKSGSTYKVIGQPLNLNSQIEHAASLS